MTKYEYFQSIVQYRQPVLEDGKLGRIQVMKTFTTAIKGTQNNRVKKSKPKEIRLEETETIEL
jgi:hypothetical protein